MTATKSRIDLSRFRGVDVFGVPFLHIGGVIIHEYTPPSARVLADGGPGNYRGHYGLNKVYTVGIECTPSGRCAARTKRWEDGIPKVVAIGHPKQKDITIDAAFERIVPVDRAYSVYDHKAMYCRRTAAAWKRIAKIIHAMPGDTEARRHAGITELSGSMGHWQDSPSWEADAVEVSPGLFCTVSVPSIGSIGSLAMSDNTPPGRKPAIYQRGDEKRGDTRLRAATESEFSFARAAVDRYLSLAAAAAASQEMAFGKLTSSVADDVASNWDQLWEYWATVAHYGSPDGVFGYIHCPERAEIVQDFPAEFMPR